MKQATLAQVAFAAAGLTATGCKDLLLRVSDTPDSPEAISRAQGVVKSLSALPLSEARSLLTEAVKTETDKQAPTYKVVKTRASEARQIIGAYKLIDGFKIEGMGWHKLVKAARDALAEKQITASGAHVPTPLEEKAQAEGTHAGQVMQRARLIAGEEGEITDDIMERAEQEVTSEREQSSQVKLAQGLVKKHGVEWCETFGEVLENLLAHMRQQSANKAIQAEAARNVQAAQ